jgi:hypothetical protein
MDCPEGTYRGPDDLNGCVACEASLGEVCPLGSTYPVAQAGYFAKLAAGGTTATVDKCIPFPYACLKTCSPEVVEHIADEDAFFNEDLGALASCDAGVGEESCTDGYEGDRCSACTPFDKSLACHELDPQINGYYRLESRCEPCPCTWFTFPYMIATVFVASLGFMFLLDTVDASYAEHASTLAAPLFILISFCQTIAVFLDTDIPWPAFLRKLMLAFSFLNFNVELTRPECSMKFSARTKVEVALAMPMFVGAVVAVYAGIMMMKVNHEHDATSDQ